jgi:hypothetical protein
MALFGSNWIEEDEPEDIGPFSHWKEMLDDSDGTIIKHFRDDDDDDDLDGPMIKHFRD